MRENQLNILLTEIYNIIKKINKKFYYYNIIKKYLINSFFKNILLLEMKNDLYYYFPYCKKVYFKSFMNKWNYINKFNNDTNENLKLLKIKLLSELEIIFLYTK